jgi:3-deoxy-manno-octulosonate cytidylyltransferase (CMP-KDO synthetase)
MITAYHIVIPARMESERLPGKPLLPIAGKTLIEHVYQRALESSAQSVVIATDNERIRLEAKHFDAQAVMTSEQHLSGSDRIAECVTLMNWSDDTLVVNLQGDEPLMPAECLDQVAELLNSDPVADMASLYWPMDDADEISDPNCVKVVTAEDDSALMFSRSVLPYPRQSQNLVSALAGGARWLRHIGLYAYRASALKKYTRQPASELERMEKLEQLRVLENGGRIVMAQACTFIPAGVDTAEDLERVRS